MGKIKGFRLKKGNMSIILNTDRLNKNLGRAQWWLDNQIMTDMVPFMPHNTGMFVDVTRAMSASLAGSGIVVAGAPPHGRYLYYGKVMVDEKTGKGPANIPGVGYRFRKGAKLVATDRPLTYSNPNARPEWFEVAKDKHLKEWIDGVEDVMKGKK